METPGSWGTNHSHVTSSGASMKITPLQWPVILISALGKSGTGSTGRALLWANKEECTAFKGAREGKRKGDKEKWAICDERLHMSWCSLSLFVSFCIISLWAKLWHIITSLFLSPQNELNLRSGQYQSIFTHYWSTFKLGKLYTTFQKDMLYFLQHSFISSISQLLHLKTFICKNMMHWYYNYPAINKIKPDQWWEASNNFDALVFKNIHIYI